jgi:TonB-linked SusC/RagA family outer membrane protein
MRHLPPLSKSSSGIRKSDYIVKQSLIIFLLLLSTAFVNAQQNITGTVTNGVNALTGVTVTVKATNHATITDDNGHFTISASPADTLLFSSIGYESKEVPVNRQTSITINLVATSGSLDEVVVTGYSTQLRKDITGSVAVVDMTALKSIPSGSAANALQGQVAGVTIINSGVPGGNSNVFIRGITSFGDTQPLVLIDGVPGNLQDINADNIASMQVLKDAGAAAIYGVRGSNGVIVITTKKGKTSSPSVTYSGYYGVQTPPHGNVLNVASPADYAKFVYKMTPNTLLFPNGELPDFTYAGPGVSGIGNGGNPAVDPSNYVFDPATPQNDYLIQRVNKEGTDWFHQVFKSAPIQNHTITMSQGSEKGNYLFSFGYLNQQGSLLETYLKRYSVRVNTQFHFNKNITVGENLYAFYKQNPPFSNQDQDNAIFFAYTMPTFIPVYDINGNYGGTWIGPDELGNRWNPVAQLKNTRNNKANAWDVFGNAYVDIDFLRHFTLHSSFGGSIDNQYNYNFFPNRYHDREQHTLVNNYDENSLYNSNWIWTNTVTYKQVFAENNIKNL